jgi:hypothetical protein
VASKANDSRLTIGQERVTVSTDRSTVFATLVIEDPGVVELVTSCDQLGEPESVLKRCVRIGSLAIGIGHRDATLDDLRHAEDRLTRLAALPDQLAARMEAVMEDQLLRLIGGERGDGMLRTSIEEASRSAAASLRETLSPIVEQLRGAGPEALPQILEARLAGVLQSATTTFFQKLLAEDGTSPLMVNLERGGAEVRELRRELTELRRELTDDLQKLARDLVAQRAAVKPADMIGRSWEADALDDVARLAAVLGDSLDFTGRTSGHGRALKGDGVLTISTESVQGLRVAIECRTGSNSLTRRELLAAVSNRDAHAGLVLAECPGGLPRDAVAMGFKIYPEDRLVALHYDRSSPSAARELAIAVLVVRHLARIATASQGTAAEAATLHEVSRHIESALADLRAIRSATSAIDKESDRIRAGTASIERGLRDALLGLAALKDLPDAA